MVFIEELDKNDLTNNKLQHKIEVEGDLDVLFHLPKSRNSRRVCGGSEGQKEKSLISICLFLTVHQLVDLRYN